MKRRNNYRERPTAEQRHAWKTEREALVNTIILQDDLPGYIVLEHIKGSQYLLLGPTGKIYASHNKQSGQWKLWEDR